MKSEAPERIWAQCTAHENWDEPVATQTRVDHFHGYIREDLKSEVTIQDAAQRLLDLLSMVETGRPEISAASAQTLWDGAHNLRGFHAVNGFLTACVNLPSQENTPS